MAKNKVNIFNKKEYKVKTSLSISDKGSLVVDIADVVFKDGIYAPYLFDVAYKLNSVSYYTNIEFPKSTNDAGEVVVDTEQAYELINSSNVMKVLEDVIDGDICENAYELIEYRKTAYLNNNGFNKLMGSLVSLVGSLENAVNKGLDGVDAAELLSTAKAIAGKNGDEIAQGVLSFQDAKAKKKS